jgi:hypothetical protein
MIIDVAKAFDLVPYDRLLYENCGHDIGFEGSRTGKRTPLRSFAES